MGAPRELRRINGRGVGGGGAGCEMLHWPMILVPFSRLAAMVMVSVRSANVVLALDTLTVRVNDRDDLCTFLFRQQRPRLDSH